MTIQLQASAACPSVYLPVSTPSSPLAGPWVALVLPEGVSLTAVPQILSDWAWLDQASSQTPSMIPPVPGFWVFAPAAPADLPSFAEALWGSPAAAVFTGTTVPVWCRNADDLSNGLQWLATGSTTGPLILSSANIGFGNNFAFFIPSGSPFTRNSASDTLTITAQGKFIFNIRGSGITGFDPSLTLALTGSDAGLLILGATLSFDPSPSSANLGIHYLYQSSGAAVTVLNYPLFDVGAAGPKIGYHVSLDPAAPFDGARTRFSFTQPATTLGAGFTSPLGQTVCLTPRSGAGLVIRSLWGTGGESCLEPDGDFTASLSPAMSDGSVALLCGSVGTEGLGGAAGSVLSFIAGAAYCPLDPTTATASDQSDPLDDRGGAAVTAWVAVSAADGSAQYRCQPAQSALFQGGAGLPDYLFTGAAFPLVAGTTLSPVPMAAYGLINSQIAKVAATPYRAFENHVLAPVRAQTMATATKAALAAKAAARTASAPAPAADTTSTYVTNSGLVATVDGEVLLSVQLAATVDAGGKTHSWVAEDISPALQTALMTNDCFLVVSRTAGSDGDILFSLSGDVAFSDWSFEPGIGADGQFLIFKYAGTDIATLAGSLANWAEAATFNADPAAVQAALLSLIATVQAAAEGGDTLYTTLWSALSDPAWNGLLALSAPANTLPEIVASMEYSLGSTLSALAVGLQVNDLSGGGDESPAVAASAPFAVVDYANPDQAASPAAGGAYGYTLDSLRAGFINGTLTSFTAGGRLEINQLFGLPAALQNDGGDATSNIVAIDGRYLQPVGDDATGYYAFSAAGPAEFRIAYDYFDGQATAQILKTVNVTNLQFVQVNDNQSRFSLNGALVFNPPASAPEDPYLYLGSPPTTDLFDFDALAYSDLGIVMTGSGVDLVYSFDVAQVRFPTPTSGLRQGLVTDLPLTAQSLSGAGSLSDLGAIAFQVPTGWTPPVDGFDYALVFAITLGSPGLLSSQAGSLTGTVYLGWGASGSYSLGLLISGIDQTCSLTLQGVMKLAIGVAGIDTMASDGTNRTVLLLQQCSLSFMGAAIPGSARPFTLTLFGAPPYPSQTLLWFGDAVPATSL
ncbi:hypothetical protein [Azospirillum lipoferum]|uniref:Uncharacterized protein n=1 Tax=Azospirillum lipoferum (strain 4B) TaxID=862719 RepID=G7ZE33_AZOL4|nr:hypothetical protein [Azospirillum lipoferum]CBS89292.1 conserved protein of unknown function [Azospirillum lipoferum 4B]